MEAKELKKILDLHLKWLRGENDGKRANLRFADLGSADLRFANLSSADLRSADLSFADLSFANLSFADLSFANLSSANLSSANLSSANLSSADLRFANLRSADLRFANLSSANLDERTIKNINTYRPFQICPTEGSFIAWKRGYMNCIIKVEIPSKARRTSSLVGRKCRASYIKTLTIWDNEGNSLKECQGWRNQEPRTIYKVNRITKADEYDPDIRVECSHGIHFFMTREEAEVW